MRNPEWMFLGVLAAVAAGTVAITLARPDEYDWTERTETEDGAATIAFVHGFRPGLGWAHSAVFSVAAVGSALALVLAVSTRRGAVLPLEEEASLRTLLAAGEIEEARRYGAERSPLARVVRAGLGRLEESDGGAARAAERAAEAEAAGLRQRSGHLLLLAVLSPLFGLVACLSRLINGLNRIAVLKGNVRLADTAHLVARSLLPTYHSLVAMMGLLCAWWFFRGRARSLGHDLALTADDILSGVPAPEAREGPEQ